jgi:hypothetical protein
MDKRANCLRVLGLPADATVSQAKLAHGDLMQVWHPDRFVHSQRLQEQAQEKSAEINAAYQWLKTQPDRVSQPASNGAGPQVAAATPIIAQRNGAPWRRRPVGLLTIAAVVGALAGVGLFVFFRFGGDIPVILSVETSPRTQVTIVPGRDPQSIFEMGQTPLHEVSGVFVGDTVILRSREHGVEHQQKVAWGRPNRELKIEVTFQRGELLVTSEPNRPGLELWRGNVRLGPVNSPVSLYQGLHHLTVKGAGLKGAITFDAVIEATQRTHLLLDVASGQVRPP